MTLTLQIVGYIFFLFMLMVAGNSVCRLLLEWSGLSQAVSPVTPSPSQAPGDTTEPAAPSRFTAGRYIGGLERMLIMVGVLAGSWEIIVAVIALKTVARIKELDERLHAEYFLVGSLTSLLWAVLITLALRWYDTQLGFNLISTLVPLAKA